MVLRFAKNRLGEDGQFEYRSLKVIQTSQPEAFDQASIALLREGLMDDSVRACASVSSSAAKAMCEPYAR